MFIKRIYIYYLTGVLVTIFLFGYNKGFFLFLLIGFGLGMLLHNWIKDMYDNTINAFFTGEIRRREMKKQVLEQELLKYKELEEIRKEQEKINKGD